MSGAPERMATLQAGLLGWLRSFKVYAEPASLRMLALGFSAGLPLLLVLGTLSFRLREAGIDRTTIGYLSWVGLAYGLKWLWAPLVDRLPLPGLTRWLGWRRSWLLLAQVGVVVGLLGMGHFNPQEDLHALVACAMLTAFSSATQDIALDAFRIESAAVTRQAALAACYQTGYRLAMIWAGAGGLWLTAQAEALGVATASTAATPSPYQNAAWQWAYSVMAASMGVGLLTVLACAEPARREGVRSQSIGEWLKSALVEPFLDFVQRYRWQAVLILSLIAIYRISDVVMGIMANPFYVDMGYTKTEVATVSKVYGVIMTLTGAFVGGAMALRLGVMRVLMLGAALSLGGNLLFAWLAGQGHNLNGLIWVVSADNLASGIASAAFIAFLSSLTNVRYSATQYALFSSLMLLAPKWLAGFSGRFVDAHGYAPFFLSTAALSLPVLVLVFFTARLKIFQRRAESPH